MDTKRYVVKVEPGIYDVGATGLQMKTFVNIEGSGQSIGATRLNGGPVNADATCAGVYDESYTFYASTCP